MKSGAKRTLPLEGRLSGLCWVSHNLHSRSFHLVIHEYVALRGAEVLVPGKLHDDLGRDAAVRELGDEAAPPAVAGCALDASPPIKLSEQLAERIWREGTVLLSAEQRGRSTR